MLKMGRFYQTTQNHNLLASDQAAPDTKRGGKVMCIVPMGAMVLLAKHGRWRYVQVIYKDMIGYLWLPTNVPTHEVFRPVLEEEFMNSKPSKGPFVKPTRPTKPK